MNKKTIIITIGIVLLILILLFGFIAYNQEKDKTGLWLDAISKDKCQDFLDGRQYVACCINEGKFYDCTDHLYFSPEQEIEILIKPDRIQDIPKGFNYVCLITDMRRQLSTDGPFISFPEHCFYYKEEYLWDIKGLTPSEIGNFTLLKANIYPDAKRNVLIEKEGENGELEISDEFTVLNLEKEIQK
jgi:hypothetical protein